MDDQARLRQAPHQLARAAGVVEVHVREHDVVDRLSRESGRVDGVEQVRHGEARADVDERRVPALDDEVARVEERALEAGVDRGDAVPEVLLSRGALFHGSRLWTGSARPASPHGTPGCSTIRL